MSWVLAALLGVLGWTFIEYTFHRFLGHEWKRVKTHFGVEHRKHHRLHNYFATTWDKAKLAVLVTAVLLVVAVPLVGWAHGAVFTGSLVSAYLGYEWFHRSLHVDAPTTAWGRWARRHHFHHHHMGPNTNHGVTSPLWDLVFGTYVAAPRVRIPRSKRPDWLPEGRSRWSRWYELVGAREA